jgi:hypothetical protein
MGELAHIHRSVQAQFAYPLLRDWCGSVYMPPRDLVQRIIRIYCPAENIIIAMRLATVPA